MARSFFTVIVPYLILSIKYGDSTWSEDVSHDFVVLAQTMVTSVSTIRSRSRRWRSIALRRAVVINQTAGLSGMPSRVEIAGRAHEASRHTGPLPCVRLGQRGRDPVRHVSCGTP